MSERDEKRGSGVGCLILGMIGFFVPVLYVLSIGPANWLVLHYPATEGVLQAIYFPLGVAGEFMPPLGRALEWYLDFWQ